MKPRLHRIKIEVTYQPTYIEIELDTDKVSDADLEDIVDEIELNQLDDRGAIYRYLQSEWNLKDDEVFIVGDADELEGYTMNVVDYTSEDAEEYYNSYTHVRGE